jgi:hypothetical protein
MEVEALQEFTGWTAADNGGPDIQGVSGEICHASQEHSLG